MPALRRRHDLRVELCGHDGPDRTVTVGHMAARRAGRLLNGVVHIGVALLIGGSFGTSRARDLHDVGDGCNHLGAQLR